MGTRHTSQEKSVIASGDDIQLKKLQSEGGWVRICSLENPIIRSAASHQQVNCFFKIWLRKRAWKQENVVVTEDYTIDKQHVELKSTSLLVGEKELFEGLSTVLEDFPALFE